MGTTTDRDAAAALRAARVAQLRQRPSATGMRVGLAADVIPPPEQGRFTGLDGLRAIAVVGVLLYHASVGWAPGGFLGVDLFFVISGFLITSLLVAERHSSGRIALKAFYLRRARRLLPALFTMLAITAGYMAIFARSDMKQARGDIGAAAGYFSNWWYVLHHRSYFVSAGRQPPFQHLWSLAIEEQFYVVWPVLLVALLLARRQLRWIAGVAIVGAAASAVWMSYLAVRGNVPYDTDPSRVYFGTDTHATALLLGAALAAVMAAIAAHREHPERHVPGAVTAVADAAGLAALAGLCWLMCASNYYAPGLYRGGFVVFAALAAAVVAAVTLPGSVLGVVLDVAPMRWIGTRSYGLYLWHWPVFVFTRPGLDWPLHGWQALAVRLALTAALTEVSYRLVEEPVRHYGLRRTLEIYVLDRLAAPRSRTTTRPVGVAAFAGRPTAGWPLTGGTPLGRPLATRSPFPRPRIVRALRIVGPVVGSATGIVAIIAATSLIAAQGTKRAAATAPRAAAASAPVAVAVQPTSPAATPSARQLAVAPPTSASATVAPTRPASTVNTPTPMKAHAAKPTTVAAHPWPTTPPPIPPGAPPTLTAVGDSVMVDTTPALQRACPSTEVYAVVGWQGTAEFAELAALKAANHLGSIVVIEAGTNGAINPHTLEAVLTSLADRTKVVVINNHVDRPWAAANNAMFPQVVKSHPNAVLLDWDATAKAHPDWLSKDGIHLEPAGDAPYAGLIKAAAGC